MDPRLTLLIRSLDQAFDQRAWHGTNLLGSLRGISETDAVWRPGPDRHNIWEIALHAAYWKYRVYRHLTDAPPRSFERKGSDWFARFTTDGVEDWSADVDLLKTWHERLRQAVALFNAALLDERPGKSKHSYFDFIAGAAAHDVYHAGQIQLIKRLKTG